MRSHGNEHKAPRAGLGYRNCSEDAGALQNAKGSAANPYHCQAFKSVRPQEVEPEHHSLD